MIGYVLIFFFIGASMFPLQDRNDNFYFFGVEKSPKIKDMSGYCGATNQVSNPWFSIPGA